MNFFFDVLTILYPIMECDNKQSDTQCDNTQCDNKQCDTECPICYQCINNDIYKTKCNHLFHKSCLNLWFSRQEKDNSFNFSCPYCRGNLDVKYIKVKNE